MGLSKEFSTKLRVVESQAPIYAPLTILYVTIVSRICDNLFVTLRLKVNVASYFVSLVLENCKLLLVSKA
ncbi:hypothetical protein Gorai_023364, partial [Gossypium raimondii]|nr:hypothetical protein [Gossypium raimondii]